MPAQKIFILTIYFGEVKNTTGKSLWYWVNELTHEKEFSEGNFVILGNSGIWDPISKANGYFEDNPTRSDAEVLTKNTRRSACTSYLKSEYMSQFCNLQPFSQCFFFHFLCGGGFWLDFLGVDMHFLWGGYQIYQGYSLLCVRKNYE